MFLPSGRVHAIGAGLVIFEIQQNSDTTYRVFDWNRTGLDGQPRELHVAQSLASIDFNDFEPALAQGRFTGNEAKVRPLVHDPLFNVETLQMKSGTGLHLRPRRLQIVAAVSGRLELQSGPTSVGLSAGHFCLIPASLERTEVSAKSGAVWLRVETN
jgi:mannose-6-phosphate isomerase